MVVQVEVAGSGSCGSGSGSGSGSGGGGGGVKRISHVNCNIMFRVGCILPLPLPLPLQLFNSAFSSKLLATIIIWPCVKQARATNESGKGRS